MSCRMARAALFTLPSESRSSMFCGRARSTVGARSTSAGCAARMIASACPWWVHQCSPLTSLPGIGPWTADLSLLFCLGHGDAWPAGDLAVQAGLAKILQLEERPSEKAVRALAEPWRPHRGAIAIMTWHCYNNAAL